MYIIPLKQIATSITPSKPATPPTPSPIVIALENIGNYAQTGASHVKHFYLNLTAHPYAKKVITSVALVGGGLICLYLILRLLTRPAVEGQITILPRKTGRIDQDQKFRFSNRIRLADQTPLILQNNDYYLAIQSVRFQRGQEILEVFRNAGIFYLPSSLLNDVRVERGEHVINFYIDQSRIKLRIENFQHLDLLRLDNLSRICSYYFPEDLNPERALKLGAKTHEIPERFTQLNPPPIQPFGKFNFKSVQKDQAQNGPYSLIPHRLERERHVLQISPKDGDMSEIYTLKSNQEGACQFWLFLPHSTNSKPPSGGRYYTIPHISEHATPTLQFYRGELHLWLERPKSLLKNPELNPNIALHARSAIPLDRILPERVNLPMCSELLPNGAVFHEVHQRDFPLECLSLYYTNTDRTGYTLWIVATDRNEKEMILDSIALGAKPRETPYLEYKDNSLRLHHTCLSSEVD